MRDSFLLHLKSYSFHEGVGCDFCICQSRFMGRPLL